MNSNTGSEDEDAVIPEKVMLAAVKYFARAEVLKDLFFAGLAQLTHKYGPEFSTILREKAKSVGLSSLDDSVRFDILVLQNTRMFMDYWHSALWVVLESYNRIKIPDKGVARVMSNPLTGKLKDYRDGIYHFKEDYFDEKTFSLLNDPNATKWVIELQDAFHGYFDKHFRFHASRRGFPDPMDLLLPKVSTQNDLVMGDVAASTSQRRNALCGCGSGKRHKHCHGTHLPFDQQSVT